MVDTECTLAAVPDVAPVVGVSLPECVSPEFEEMRIVGETGVEERCGSSLVRIDMLSSK